MIGYLKGKVLNVSAETALIEVGGIGYEVTCSLSALSRCNQGETAEVYTYLQAKEDGISLFGFVNLEEKDLFLKLISVSGIGPKTGVGILSSMSINDLALAIATSDVKKLSTVKGLGKKSAERIILELREKVSAPAPSGVKGLPVQNNVYNKDEDDAEVALMTLGLTKAEAQKAITIAKEQGANGLEEIVAFALKAI